jgi:hypothetical protein
MLQRETAGRARTARRGPSVGASLAIRAGRRRGVDGDARFDLAASTPAAGLTARGHEV